MRGSLTDQEFIDHLSDILGEPLVHCRSHSGGSESVTATFVVNTATKSWFVKVVRDARAMAMLGAEKDGLEAIHTTRTIRTPKAKYVGPYYQTSAILVMEYIQGQYVEQEDLKKLGRQLAQLHQKTNAQFGWAKDNFIGRLPQPNAWYSDWNTFYVEKRLSPQLLMACDAQLLDTKEIPDPEHIHRRVNDMLPPVKASLLHGDLWHGNVLISKWGVPYLIDPAVYYGHAEADLAMCRLFGGFGEAFYAAYAEIIPPEPGAGERSVLYQLYYLLVHLNMFGSSYKPPVKWILKRYFN